MKTLEGRTPNPPPLPHGNSHFPHCLLLVQIYFSSSPITYRTTVGLATRPFLSFVRYRIPACRIVSLIYIRQHGAKAEAVNPADWIAASFLWHAVTLPAYLRRDLICLHLCCNAATKSFVVLSSFDIIVIEVGCAHLGTNETARRRHTILNSSTVIFNPPWTWTMTFWPPNSDVFISLPKCSGAVSLAKIRQILFEVS